MNVLQFRIKLAMGNACCSSKDVHSAADGGSPKAAVRANGGVTTTTHQPRQQQQQANGSSTNGTTNGKRKPSSSKVTNISITTSSNKQAGSVDSTTTTITPATTSSTNTQNRSVSVTATATTNGCARKNSEGKGAENITDSVDSPTAAVVPQFSFPPVLEDFNLLDCDVDPTELEEVFVDDRLKEITLELHKDSPPMGFTIVGGVNTEYGDLPIVVKRVSPDGLAHAGGQLRVGDEVVAVNDTLLLGQTQEFATRTFKRFESGVVRILVLQDPE